MNATCSFRAVSARLALTTAALAFSSGAIQAQQPAPNTPAATFGGATITPKVSPWGISCSSSLFRTFEEWVPKAAAMGVVSIRLFPEWPSAEPAPDQWKWEKTDALMRVLEANHMENTGIFMGTVPGSKQPGHTFPMTDLDRWAHYVGEAAGRYRNQITRWEVWNEGNGGFNGGKHTTEDYAKLATATYEAAKKANPKAQIGLSVASFDLPYLQQAIAAMAKAGRPNNFDYLAIHPYEVTDALYSTDGEIAYLWMTAKLREMLKAQAPERANAEIWVTEVGRKIHENKPQPEQEAKAAMSAVKVYTMGIAEGIARTCWFEFQDPIGEESGFGLLRRNGSERLSYHALHHLVGTLGPQPKYLGWLALGEDGRGYGFVFQGSAGPVLVAWMPAKMPPASIQFGAAVEVADPMQEKLSFSPRAVGAAVSIAQAPVFVRNLPALLVKQAQINNARPFPWGGDFTNAKSVSVQFGGKPSRDGLFILDSELGETVSFPDGTSGALSPAGKSLRFFAHPTFTAVKQNEYYVRITCRRKDSATNLGMNFWYELADTKGRMPYKNPQQWWTVPKEEGWQTHVWHVKDACFSKMWGSDFYFTPEQSGAFVVSKVEVSKVPFP